MNPSTSSDHQGTEAANPPPGRWQRMVPARAAPWLPAALLILVQLASGMRDLPQSAFFLIYLQERLGLAPVTISSIVSGALLVGTVTALLGGSAAARLGSKRVLLAGLALSAVGSLALQAPWPALAAGLWLAGGAGLSLVTVGGSSYLTRISARGGIGVLAAFYALSTTAGGALGNPLAGVLIERHGFTAFSWTAIAISAGTILVVALFMERYHDPAAGPSSLRSFFSGIRDTTRQPNVRMLAGLRSLPTIFYGMLTVLIPLLLNELSGSKVLVAAYGATNLVVASAAQLLAGRAADRWGARRPTLVAYTALLLSGLGLAAGVRAVWSLYLFGVLGIAAAWSLSTLMYVWVSDGLPKSGHPAAFGLLHAVWSLSMITGSLLGGWFVTTLPGLPFLAGGLLNIVSLFLIQVYYRRNETSQPLIADYADEADYADKEI